MPSITFDSRAEANRVRDLPVVRERLADADDRRTTTVTLERGTPDRIVERLEGRALATARGESSSRGMSELTDQERQALERGHRSFTWRAHGLEAMRVKAALASRGVTEWTDYYEPGEGVPGALANLEATKERSAATGAAVGMTGDYTDEEELVDRGARGRQVERAQAADVDRAKEPAILEADEGAIEFLREEREGFGVDVFDLFFSEGEARGRDAELVEERHAERSAAARQADELQQAPVTRDPLVWAAAPNRYDFPGVDVLDPEAYHETRSERAQAADEARTAPLTDDPAEWAERPDELDMAGVDAPEPEDPLEEILGVEETGQAGLGGDLVDVDPQAAFEVEEDVRRSQGRGSRVEEAAASEFGVDDRVLDERAGFDEATGVGLEAFGGGARENEALDELLGYGEGD